MTTKTYVIDSFDEIITIGTTLGQNWFRGHSKIFNELTPGIFRKQYRDKLYVKLSPNPEMRIAEEFKRRAPSVTNNLPSNDEHLEWLFLMQHYGLPTRLLDWSENVLSATFFAVNSDYEEDGEIWTFLPWRLNEFNGFYGLPILSKNRTVKFLSHEIFHNNSKELAETYNLEEIPKTPIALQPPLNEARLSAQESCFTIHPEPLEGYRITDLIKDENFLVRYIIPKQLKKNFEKKLAYLGISYRTLFPDLEGLAKSILKEEESFGWGQPPSIKLKEYE